MKSAQNFRNKKVYYYYYFLFLHPRSNESQTHRKITLCDCEFDFQGVTENLHSNNQQIKSEPDKGKKRQHLSAEPKRFQCTKMLWATTWRHEFFTNMFNPSIAKSISTMFVKPCPYISRIIKLEIKRALLGNSYLDFFSSEHQSQLICGFLALLNLKLCGILLFTKLQQMNSETLYLIKKEGKQ